MAAISGTFAQGRAEPIASAAVWGTGVHPIHARPFNTDRRHTPETHPGDGNLPANVTENADDYGYMPEDGITGVYGYGTETGLADRPRLGESPRGNRAAVTEGFPSHGMHHNGLPGGTKLRSILHGALLTMGSRVFPRKPIVEGVIPSPTQSENYPVVSDARQLIMQTSMVQRHQTRAGSQSSGTASEYKAPIPSRIAGMRLPVYAGGERHEDMRPQEQSTGMHRPFIPRQVGTGDPAEMETNAMYESRPIQRQSTSLPDLGPKETDVVDSAPGVTEADSLGYTDEDPLW